MKALFLAGGGAAASVVAVPLLAILAVVGAGAATGCGAGGGLAADADVPARARPWVFTAHAACPDLPPSWIAAVMAQESGFDPDAYADDANGGTWGLFQLNSTVWAAAYGAGWAADRNGDGVADVRDPAIHAHVAGVRALRAAHPDWASTVGLTELDALIVAHNAGESRLTDYPAIPAITARFIRDVREHAAAWRTGCRIDDIAPAAGARRPREAIAAVVSMVGTSTGWYRLCDRLVCRAYGYANSGYPTAAAHWVAMVESGAARAGDRCSPAGAFVYWAPDPGSDGAGHVALVTAADPSCDPRRIAVVSNDVGDTTVGQGGVYQVSLAALESGFVRPDRYLGWAPPICAGALHRSGTTS
jgi:hypothetical protein